MNFSCDNVNDCAVAIGVPVAALQVLVTTVVAIIKLNNPSSTATPNQVAASVLDAIPTSGPQSLPGAVAQVIVQEADLISTPEQFDVSVFGASSGSSDDSLADQVSDFSLRYQKYSNYLASIAPSYDPANFAAASARISDFFVNILGKPLAQGGLLDAKLPLSSTGAGPQDIFDYLIANDILAGQIQDLVNQTLCAFNNGTLPAKYTPISSNIIEASQALGVSDYNQFFVRQLAQDFMKLNPALTEYTASINILVDFQPSSSNKSKMDQVFDSAYQVSLAAGLDGQVTVAVFSATQEAVFKAPGNLTTAQIQQIAQELKAASSSSSGGTTPPSKGDDSGSSNNGNSTQPGTGDLGNFQEVLGSTTYYQSCYNAEGQFNLATFQNALALPANQAQIRQELIDIGESLAEDKTSQQYKDYESARKAYTDEYGEDSAIPE